MKIRVIIVLLGIVLFGIAQLAFACPADAQYSGPENSGLEKSGLETWRKIHDVLSHSRCSNCHVGSDNRPMWSEPGNVSPRLHGMNIDAGESRIGAETLPCGTCHSKANAEIPHGPPGAET